MIIEKDGQIIVDELQPMSEAAKDGSRLLAVTVGSVIFFEAYFHGEFWRLEGTSLLLKDNNFAGWIPMPIYKPNRLEE